MSRFAAHPHLGEDQPGGGSGTVAEVRLVRRASPSGPYLNVVEPVRRTFLKVSSRHPLPAEGVPYAGTITDSVEIVTLVIPAGAAKSSEDNWAPNPAGMLSAGIREGYETTVSLRPVELYSDLNNDGELTSADGGLVGKPYASGASEAEKDKGTEFMFANDNLSNGAWDKEDTTTPGKPDDADDDDAEPIFVGIGALPDESKVWLEHPATAGLKFYRDRECTEEIPLSSSQPYVVGGSVEWPDDNIVEAIS